MDNQKILYNIFLVLFAFFVILILFISHLMYAFLVPIIIGFFTAFLFQPFILKLEKFKTPTWLSIIIVLLAAICIISLLFFLLFISVEKFLSDLPVFLKSIQTNVYSFIDYISDISLIQNNIDSEKIKNSIDDFISEINIAAYMIITMTKTFEFLKTFFIYILALIFILPGMHNLPNRISKAFPKKKDTIKNIILIITKRIQSYLIIKSIISLFIASLVTLVCIIFQIKYALFWGFITFIFHYIPYLGAFSSISIISLYSYIQHNSLAYSLVILLIIISLYILFSEIIEPNMQSEGVNLSPFVIFVSLFIWGYLWGIAGVFLAVPIMATINLVCENIESLRPLSIMISTRKKTKVKYQPE